MKQGRTPDKVHIVQPPEDDFSPENESRITLPSPSSNPRAMEIIRTLAQISDKLKRSEAERYELLAELREYRKSINELEDKADKSEKAYIALESKLNTKDASESEISQRQARFERALKEAESKLVQAAASQNLLDSRLKQTEEFQANVTQRLDDTVVQQARIDRQIEKIGQDKARVLRKLERMDEILSETQGTLKARALVLLTDQSAAAQAAGFPQIPAYADKENDAGVKAPWWRSSVRMQSVGLASMVIAALLFGWTLNQVQQPDIPRIAVLENGGMAQLDLEKNRWEPLPTTSAANPETVSLQGNDLEAPAAEQADTSITATPVAETPETSAESAPVEQSENAQAVMNASDDELLAALESDPDKLAAQLNDIAPEVGQALDLEAESVAPAAPALPVSVPPAQKAEAKGYSPLNGLEAKAYGQSPAVANKIAQEKQAAPIAQRIQRDESLPSTIQTLETKAFNGVAEAQHDLAAIYTAGRGNVTQDFDKAAVWFGEAANNGVANAAYNLGVLYHQGLGVERDLDRALYWYREAAKKGHPEAQYNLGIAYIEGIGTAYDAPLAAAFFESSANQGVIEAAYNLGLIYENGLVGGSPKPEDAILWYKIAADGGSTDAKAALQQLASSMRISLDEVNKMAERMQSVYTSSHGRPAGPKKS